MKVTDKKFLNVHQTISPLSVATTVTASSTKGGESSPSSKAEKILVSWTTRKKYLQMESWVITNQLTHVNILDGLYPWKINSVNPNHNEMGMISNTSWTLWEKFLILMWVNHCPNLSGTSSSDLFSKIGWEKFFWQTNYSV